MPDEDEESERLGKVWGKKTGGVKEPKGRREDIAEVAPKVAHAEGLTPGDPGRSRLSFPGI